MDGSPLYRTPKTPSVDSGKIIYTFGSKDLIKSSTWLSTGEKIIDIKNLIVHENNSKTLYMFDNLHESCLRLGDRIFDIGKEICTRVFGESDVDYELSLVDASNQNPIKAIGRISCDSEGKLDYTSAILLGSDESQLRSVRLNFSKTKSFGIFPGQVVMVCGSNPTGDTILVDEIIGERILPSISKPTNTEELNFVIASGPFTNNDDLVYEPLNDLVHYCKNHRPDIIIGPFLSDDHNLIQTTNTISDDFDSIFEKTIKELELKQQYAL